MFTLFWKYILSFFTADKIGCILRIMLIKSGTTLASEILDPKNQKKAIEFVKELNADNTIDNMEKARLFNTKMLAWLQKIGKKMAESSINCLRELAVNAVKIEKD